MRLHLNTHSLRKRIFLFIRFYVFILFNFFFHSRTNLIPPSWLNFNFNSSSDTSKVHYELEYRLKGKRQFDYLKYLTNKDEFCVLDWGCGFSPLGSYIKSNQIDSIKYIGVEPDKKAVRWLKNSLGGTEFLSFYRLGMNKENNYIYNKSAVRNLNLNIDELINLDFIPDIVFSSSVFTHMFPSHATETFHKLNLISTDETLFVFTWLILDQTNKLSVEEGVADRKLPFHVNEIYTYSLENPLVCTAYELSKLNEVYREGGHEIVNIYFGSWSGGDRNNALGYQDVVISRKIKL